jgi:hypothetical protein
VRRSAGEEPEERDGWELIEMYLGDVYRSGQFTAEDRAAFLDALATTDVTGYGVVTDRAGREGLAFGSAFRQHGLVDEHRIIIDPETGEVFGSEDILTGPLSPGGRKETVKSYDVLLESGYTDALPDCGDIGCRTMPLPG